MNIYRLTLIMTDEANHRDSNFPLQWCKALQIQVLLEYGCLNWRRIAVTPSPAEKPAWILLAMHRNRCLQ